MSVKKNYGQSVCKRPSRIAGPQPTRKKNKNGVNARWKQSFNEVHVIAVDAVTGRRSSTTTWVKKNDHG